MRLQEIICEATPHQATFLQENDWDSPAEVLRWLRSKGYTQKGSGVYSRVFVHPRQKTIIKISKQEDRCWLKFAYWTLKMSSHPNVPFIHWIRKYGKQDQFFIAEIEKLLPYNRAAVMNTVDLVGLVYLFTDAYGQFIGDAAIRDRLVKDEILKDGSYYNDHKIARKWLRTAKGGRRFIHVIKKYKKMAHGFCEDDLHDGNIMYRPSDRRLVITDPLSG